LPGFRACAQKNYQPPLIPAEINADSGPIVNPQFAQSISDRSRVSKIAIFDPIQSNLNGRNRAVVRDRRDPFEKRRFAVRRMVITNLERGPQRPLGRSTHENTS
jgi:hypothetical protein